MEINNDEVICPNCVHQFRAVPVNVQAALAAKQAEVDRLIDALSNPMLTGIQIGSGSMEFGVEGGGPQLLAGMFLGLLDKHPGATNYVEVTFNSTRGPITVTVRQPNGKTPHQLREQAEKELAALREKVLGCAAAAELLGNHAVAKALREAVGDE